MARVKLFHGHTEYWMLVTRAPTAHELRALESHVARALADAAPLAPGQHARIILDALTREQRRLNDERGMCDA